MFKFILHQEAKKKHHHEKNNIVFFHIYLLYLTVLQPTTCIFNVYGNTAQPVYMRTKY